MPSKDGSGLEVVAEATHKGKSTREVKSMGMTPPMHGAVSSRPVAEMEMSRKIGWSTDFGKEKADVVVSIRLPCGTTPEELDETARRLRQLLDRYTESELDYVVDKYFEGGPVVFGSGRHRS